MSSTLPAMAFKTVPFLGTEAEGPYKGDRVLFLPGTVNLTQYRKVRSVLHGVQGLYYGAGNNRDVNPVTFMALTDDAKQYDLRLTIEVDARHQWLKWLRDRCPYLVLYFDNNANTESLQGYADYHKTLIDGVLTWTKVDEPSVQYKTQLDCALFEKDVDLEV